MQPRSVIEYCWHQSGERRGGGKQVDLWGLYYGTSSDQSHSAVIRIFLSLCSHIPLPPLLKKMTIIDLLREAERSPLPFRGQGRGQKLPTPLARTENKYRGLPLHSHGPAKPDHLHYPAAVRASHTKSP